MSYAVLMRSRQTRVAPGRRSRLRHLLAVVVTLGAMLVGFAAPAHAAAAQTLVVPLDGMTISATNLVLSGSVRVVVMEAGAAGSDLTIRSTLEKVSFTDGTVTCKVTGSGSYQGTLGTEADFSEHYPVLQSADCAPVDLVLQYQFSFGEGGNVTNVAVTPFLTKHA